MGDEVCLGAKNRREVEVRWPACTEPMAAEMQALLARLSPPPNHNPDHAQAEPPLAARTGMTASIVRRRLDCLHTDCAISKPTG
jgi:hypothetical protein